MGSLSSAAWARTASAATPKPASVVATGGTRFTGLPWQIPKDFLGSCLINWPNGGFNFSGVLKYGSARMTQLYEARWSTIETSPGVYSSAALAILDSIITAHRQNGATVLFGVYGVPAFYANNATANPTYTDAQTEGPWNALGECAMPDSAGANYNGTNTGNNSSGLNGLTALYNFCQMIATRYNGAGGSWFLANGAALGKAIAYWEMGNEPHFAYPSGASVGNGNTTGSGGPGGYFWWDSANHYVDYCYTQRQAVKAIDSTILMCNGGFAGNPTGLGKVFLQASGAINTGITGYATVDALASHWYGLTPEGTVLGAWGSNRGAVNSTGADSGVMGITYTSTNMAATDSRFGIANLPYWCTESGVCEIITDGTTLAWYNAPAPFRKRHMKRLLKTLMGQRVSRWDPWHAEDIATPFFSGNWQTDTGGVIAAYNELAVESCGKTLIDGAWISGGPVLHQYSDGTMTID